MLSLRVGAALTALALLLPVSAQAGEKEKLSALSKITVTDQKNDVTVTVVGTKSPDFTSFTMSNPFRVVVDWAGSRIEGAAVEQKFPRGLIRSVRTKQYDSEAERISRVTVELSRETAYHVDAAGTRVTIHFEPVADPIPEPEPKPAPVAEKKEKKKELAYVPEGPLTEPDLPVPENPPAPKPAPPPVVAKAEPAPPPVAAAPVVVAKVEPPKAPPPKVEPPKAETKPVVVAEVEPKKEEKKVEPAPKKEAPKAPAPPIVVAKKESPKETKKAEPKPAPAAVALREEPKAIATYVPKPKEEPMRVRSPSPKPVRVTPNRRTRQIASSAPRDLHSTWRPPGAGRVRGLPVVHFGVGQETIQPQGETPVDPDEPATVAGDSDFDPGPHIMKYIGFRQMADVSRVFVRLDGKAKYTKRKEGDTVVVELVDTSVPVKNNTRPLDTSYFNSPVGNVQAVPSGNSTRIEIRLKEQVPFQVKRIGTTIAIDFTRK